MGGTWKASGIYCDCRAPVDSQDRLAGELVGKGTDKVVGPH
jgi:hypothetical protein